jgi:MFS family permease
MHDNVTLVRGSARARIKTTIHMLCAYSFIGYAGIFVLGWWVIAGFMPPHPPTSTAPEIVARLQSNVLGIRIGMVLSMVAAMLYMPLTAIISYHIEKIEGYIGPLTWCQIMAGVCSVMLTYTPAMWWLVATFRLDRPPEETLMLNDIAWLNIVGGLTIYLPTLFTISIASFMDDSPAPAFPRWFGYMCILVFFGQASGQLIFFFKTGPFAWNGLFAFYIPMIAFFVWFVAAFYLMRKATIEHSRRPDWEPGRA